MGVSLLVDNLPSLPESLPDGSLLFRVALPAQEIRIISGAARPVDFGHPVDQRRLGVAVLGLPWGQGGGGIDAPTDAPAVHAGVPPAAHPPTHHHKVRASHNHTTPP